MNRKISNQFFPIEQSNNMKVVSSSLFFFLDLQVHLVSYTRPLIVLGPFKEVLNDQLLNDYPEKFSNCVPRQWLLEFVRLFPMRISL